MTCAPAALPFCAAAITVASGFSSCNSTVVAPFITLPSMCSGAKASFAPGTTIMEFCPVSATKMSATPLVPGVMPIPFTSQPTLASSCFISRPKLSSPMRPSIAVLPPMRAAANAWLAPLPPGAVKYLLPMMVSPGTGMRGDTATTSMFRLPTTTILATCPPATTSNYWLAAVARAVVAVL